jgi:UDP-sugar transporter A1/2/3
MVATEAVSRSSSEMEEGILKDDDKSPLLNTSNPSNKQQPDETTKGGPAPDKDASVVTSLGLKILCLLAVQNCMKNLLMRYIMKEKPNFLTSAAVIGVEIVKLILCVLYILLIDKRPLSSIYTFMRDDYKHAILLTIPAAAYSFQMSMEYVALANLDAAVFSVLVQSKLLTTASFSAVILRKRFKYIQIVSLVLLTVGVMLININNKGSEDESNNSKGVLATLGKHWPVDT